MNGIPPMLPGVTLPPSLAALLMSLESCFTAPTFRTFCALLAGFIAQTGRRTVCGMLLGAGLSRLWPHDRAHYFFARARWCPQRLGLRLARLVVATLLPEGTPVLVVIDDTLFKRRGKKVWAVGWFHDGSAAGPKPSGYGNNWVVAGIVVTLPFSARPVCLPVLARLVVKNSVVTDSPSASRRDLARAMIETLAVALPGRTVHGVGDAAYSGKGITGLDEGITWTTRLRADAALHRPAPHRTGRRGRPRSKGQRLPSLRQLAAQAAFTPHTVRRYGHTGTVHTAVIHCLWYSVFGQRPVQAVLIRDNKPAGFDLALISTDTTATPSEIVARYAARWSIEVAFQDAKQIFGAGHAHNRTARAVHRTIPFALTSQTITMLWYATAGHHPADITDHRDHRPWHATKTQPSTADMIAKLRRVLTATKYRPTHPHQPTPAEIHTIRLAWETTAA